MLIIPTFGIQHKNETMALFQATDIITNTNKTDKEIDQMVYEQYGLTDEEITIVEGGV